MNETRAKAFDAAMTLSRNNAAKASAWDREDAQDVLDIARRFESYLEGTETHVESGADAEAVADKPWSNVVQLAEHAATGSSAAPSPATPVETLTNGAGADAPSKGEDGRFEGEADEPVARPKSSKPKKPRKEKKAKARREKKVTAPVEAEPVAQEPPVEAPAGEPALVDAA